MIRDADALHGLPLFAGLADHDREELAVGLEERRLRVGEVLFEQSDPGSGAFLILEGMLRLGIRMTAHDRIELGTATAGELLGELALIDGRHRSATAVAETDVRALWLPRGFYEALLGAGRPAAFTILRQVTVDVARRVRATIREIDQDVDPAGPAAANPVLASRLVSASAPADAEVVVGRPDEVDVHDLVALPPLRRFEPRTLATLLDGASPLHLPRRHAVLDEGAATNTAYLVVRGALQPMTGSHDRRIKLPLIGPGETAGEVALLDGQPQPVTVVSRERATVVPISRSRLGELLARRDTAGLHTLRYLSAILTEMIRRINRRYTWFEADQRGWAG